MVVSMSEKEFSRLDVLMDVQAGRLVIDEAAQLLKLKRRQIFRRCALNELNIDIICANSPQAKGRVERPFGTLQDRRFARVLEEIAANAPALPTPRGPGSVRQRASARSIWCRSAACSSTGYAA
jgi:hypothetical protein